MAWHDHFQEFIMSATAHSFLRLSPLARLACTAAAAVCATAVNLALLGLFDHSSSAPWLNPTPQVLQAQAQCDTLQARTAREHCTRELVARTLAPGLRTAQVGAR